MSWCLSFNGVFVRPTVRTSRFRTRDMRTTALAAIWTHLPPRHREVEGGTGLAEQAQIGVWTFGRWMHALAYLGRVSIIAARQQFLQRLPQRRYVSSLVHFALAFSWNFHVFLTSPSTENKQHVLFCTLLLRQEPC